MCILSVAVSLVVSSSKIRCLERHISKISHFVPVGMWDSAFSLILL